MPVRHGLLVLLAERPCYGYELRGEFERRTGATWPLNIGQVYTTLARLERDGCVTAQPASEAGHQYYEITAEGRSELEGWFTTPVRREARPRDELAIKLALASGSAGVDLQAVLRVQRADSMRALQDHTRLKIEADGEDLPWLLVVDGVIFQIEAELRWLDHCEKRLQRAARKHVAQTPSRPPVRT